MGVHKAALDIAAVFVGRDEWRVIGRPLEWAQLRLVNGDPDRALLELKPNRTNQSFKELLIVLCR